VLTVTGEDFDPVQVVNFLNPLSRRRNPGSEAVRTATAGAVAGSPLRLVTLPYLIALKLYAGGYKSRLDVLELLTRNPDASEARSHWCAPTSASRTTGRRSWANSVTEGCRRRSQPSGPC